MCSSPVPQAAFEDGLISLVRPLHGLSDLDVAEFEAGLVIFPGTWNAEPFEDCDGEVSLLLTSRNGDDEMLSFSVTRAAEGLRLTAWRGDAHGPAHRFARPQDALGFAWKLAEAEYGETPTEGAETAGGARRLVSRDSARA